MDFSSLNRTLDSFKSCKVCVFGDFCLDAYWIVDHGADELSLETGKAVRRVKKQYYSLGGAGNVIANLIDLGVGRVQAVGVLGSDLFGEHLLELLRQRGADTSRMLMLESDWQTMVYAKPCRDGVEDQRVDFGGFNVLPDGVGTQIIASLEKACAENDVVVLNQQVPASASTPAVIGEINRLIATYSKTKFIVDARDHAALYRGAVLKLNGREASRLLGDGGEAGSEIADRRLAEALFEKNGQPVVLTRGEHGMLVADSTGVHTIRGIQIIQATDPVGAGDTVVAALAAVLGGGGDAVTAGEIANLAASVTVRKLQTTGTATPDEIRHAAKDADRLYAPDLAEDLRLARVLRKFRNRDRRAVAAKVAHSARDLRSRRDVVGIAARLGSGDGTDDVPRDPRRPLSPRSSRRSIAGCSTSPEISSTKRPASRRSCRCRGWSGSFAITVVCLKRRFSTSTVTKRSTTKRCSR